VPDLPVPDHAGSGEGPDDGVRAEDFVLVAQLDPALAAAAVRMLRREGFIAYVRGAVGGDVAGTADGLFVARPTAVAARRLLDEQLPRMRDELRVGEAGAGGVPGTDPAGAGQDVRAAAGDQVGEQVDDEVWAELVAAFRGPSADVSHRALPPFDPAPQPVAEPAPAPVEAHADLDEVFAEEHYEPDPPPPLPRIGWLLGTAWAAVLGTPILFLVALWVHVDVTGWLGAIGVSVFVGGFLVLVSRLGDGPDEWDDGAVV
jgi:hypothetical protein